MLQIEANLLESQPKVMQSNREEIAGSKTEEKSLKSPSNTNQHRPNRTFKLECEFDENMYQKRHIKVNACADIYEQWRASKRLYKKAPREGLEFQIDYIDTGLALPEDVREKAPIVLVLHGAPGSYEDFALLIQHLGREQVRVIAPNFPEYPATVEKKVLFRHSGDEKAAYLRDFLRAIKITKIDLLVSHSSAIFPTLLILLNANRGNNVDKLDKQADEATALSEQKRIQDKAKSELDASEEIEENFQDARDDTIEASEDDTHDDDSDITAEVVDLNNNKERLIDGNKLSCTMEDESIKDNVDPRGALDCRQQMEKDSLRAEEIRKKLLRDVKTRKKTRFAPPLVKFEEPIEIKAVALFNPAGHRLPKSMKPTWFKCGSVHCYQHKIGRYWFRKLGPAFLTIVGVPVKVDNMDNVMLSATVMRNSKCARVMSQLEHLSQLKVPTLLVFSENDKLIEKEIFYEMTQFMNLNPKTFDIFDQEGDIEYQQARHDDWIRVMVFKAGGHYAYSNYAKTVNKAVSDLLAKTRSY